MVNAIKNSFTQLSAVNNHGSVGYQLLVVFIAFGYGGMLSALPLEVFSDRVNYLNYAANSWDILVRYWSTGLSVGLFNEPLWLLLNSVLAQVFSPETVLRLIIFGSAALVAWQVLRQDSRYFFILLVFLLLPQVVGYHITGLRQGVAIALFLTGWYVQKRSWRWLLIGMTPFVHASFFFVILLLALTGIARQLKLATDLRTLLFVSAGLGTSVMLGPFVAMVGARQAEVYSFSTANVSGLGFLFWTAIFFIMCLQGRTFIRQYAFEYGAVVFYLSTYFLIEVTGRIFESTLLLVLMAGLHLSGWRRQLFIAMIIGYGALQYLLRVREPWLGFGAT